MSSHESQAYHEGVSPAENTSTYNSNNTFHVSPQTTGEAALSPAPLFSSPEPKSLGGTPVYNLSPVTTPGFPSPSPPHYQSPVSPFIPTPIASPSPRPTSQLVDAYQGIEVVPQNNEKMSAQIQQPVPEYTSYPAGEKGVHSPQVQQVHVPQQQQQQQQQPIVQQQGQYPTAWPIRALQQNNAVVDCPVCGVRQVTTTNFIIGNTTNAWAAVICIVACLGCIPYLFTGTKDVEHKCGNCGVTLATWHRSGRTEVHVPQGMQVPIQQQQQQQRQ